MCKCLAAGGHCPLSACSPTIGGKITHKKKEPILLVNVLYSVIKTTNKTEVTFCNNDVKV